MPVLTQFPLRPPQNRSEPDPGPTDPGPTIRWGTRSAPPPPRTAARTLRARPRRVGGHRSRAGPGGGAPSRRRRPAGVGGAAGRLGGGHGPGRLEVPDPACLLTLRPSPSEPSPALSARTRATECLQLNPTGQVQLAKNPDSPPEDDRNSSAEAVGSGEPPWTSPTTRVRPWLQALVRTAPMWAYWRPPPLEGRRPTSSPAPPRQWARSPIRAGARVGRPRSGSGPRRGSGSGSGSSSSRSSARSAWAGPDGGGTPATMEA